MLEVVIIHEGVKIRITFLGTLSYAIFLNKFCTKPGFKVKLR